MLSRYLLSVNSRSVLSKSLHTSSRAFAATTKGQAPEASRRPQERTNLDQNPHLKHAVSSAGGNTGRDMGKGNAAPNPELPSKKLEKSKGKSVSDGTEKSKRGLHTSAVYQAGSSSGKHSADHYAKDVDMNPPQSSTTHSVDGASEAVQRPNQQYADPKKDYATISKDEPYAPPAEEANGSGVEKGEQKDQKLGYGGTERDASKQTSGSSEGPESASGNAGGRKPEQK